MALLNRLVEAAGLDLDSLARRVASSGEFGARVVTEFLRRLPAFDQLEIDQMPGLQIALSSMSEAMTSAMQEVETSSLTQSVTGMFDSPGFKEAISSTAKLQLGQRVPVLDAT